MNTIYRFHKDGRKYSGKGANRFEAQNDLELQWGISLKGAIFEEIYKLQVVRMGKVR